MEQCGQLTIMIDRQILLACHVSSCCVSKHSACSDYVPISKGETATCAPVMIDACFCKGELQSLWQF